MKQQGKKDTVEKGAEKKGKSAEKTQAVERPLGAKKLPALKSSAAKVKVTEKPVIAEKSKTAVNSVALAIPKASPLGIQKKYIESRNICEVTFRLPGEASLKADKVTVVGDFNNWEKEATPLEKQKNGDFTTIIELDAGKEYRFRYLIDGQRWENDWNADKYVKSLYDVEDSVVCA
ncbi:MAG: isoamylase early set domain-containing protein [Nitrospirota bacterium]|nr:isoamylase early set domain-containing protein [Nitrospirota bacterium]